MTLLKVEQIALLQDGHWLALTFTGPHNAYSQLCRDLSRERPWAYWHPGQGWIISEALLSKYSPRFSNFQQKFEEAKHGQIERGQHRTTGQRKADQLADEASNLV